MQANLQKMLNTYKPYDLTHPRSLEECQLFRSITEKWHAEDNAHRPLVPVYPRIYMEGELGGGKPVLNPPGEPTLKHVDFKGLVDPPFFGDCTSRDDYRTTFREWKAAPYDLDGETVFVSRICHQTNLVAGQVERFQMLLATHSRCAEGELEPFDADDVAKGLSLLWETWGALDFEVGVSTGALLVAADSVGVRIHAGVRSHLDEMGLDRKFDRQLGVLSTILMLKKKWFQNPEAFSAIDRPAG